MPVLGVCVCVCVCVCRHLPVWVVVLVELCIVASDERTGGFVCRCCEGRSEEDEGGGEDGSHGVYSSRSSIDIV
jgi:hypothetical protein